MMDGTHLSPTLTLSPSWPLSPGAPLIPLGPLGPWEMKGMIRLETYEMGHAMCVLKTFGCCQDKT